MKESEHTYQATDSYDSNILGSGSGAVLLEWAKDRDTATEHRRSHSRWDPFWNLRRDSICVCQGTTNVRSDRRVHLDHEVGGNTRIVGILEHR